MIVNQLIQLCAVNILLFCFSFSSECVTFFIFCSSLSLEMLFLLFVLLNLHFLNLLDEYSLSLSVLNSFLSSFFFFGQLYNSRLYLCLLMRVYLQLNLCFHTVSKFGRVQVRMGSGNTLPKGITGTQIQLWRDL
jgi:hypothetical protein